MDESKHLGRREFTVQSALAILSGVAITVSACDGNAGNPTSPSTMPGDESGSLSTMPGDAGDESGSPSAMPEDVSGLVGTNHGHVATIMQAQLTAGGAISLDIRGGADHPHTVELTAKQVQQIGEGARVSVESSVERVHRHTVTFN